MQSLYFSILGSGKEWFSSSSSLTKKSRIYSISEEGVNRLTKQYLSAKSLFKSCIFLMFLFCLRAVLWWSAANSPYLKRGCSLAGEGHYLELLIILEFWRCYWSLFLVGPKKCEGSWYCFTVYLLAWPSRWWFFRTGSPWHLWVGLGAGEFM